MSRSEKHPMRLKVSNFGPIVTADVELRPLTVFVGPSNTGKSYLAILIYALQRVLGGYVDSVDHMPLGYGLMRRHRRLGRHLMEFPPESKVSAQQAGQVLDWLKQISSEPRKNTSSAGIRLPDAIATLVRPHLLQLVRAFQDELDTELQRCFGLGGTQQLVHRPGAKKTQIMLNRRGTDDSIEYRFNIGQSKPPAPSITPENPPLSISGDILDFLRRGFGYTEESGASQERIATRMLSLIALSAFRDSFDDARQPTYYLPADRTGVMHAHRVVVSALIDNATSAGIRRAPAVPLLSGVLADFLEQLIGMGEARGRDTGIGEALANGLEQQVLKGSVRDEPNPLLGKGYPAFFYRPEGWKKSLPLMNASSMVSELAPVVLYLRHVVREGDMLIIEEPESHLHPAMQVAFIRHLGRAVRAGVRIIVTTHSEWILEELANLVRASDIPEAQRAGLPSAEQALSPAQVGVWLFSPSQRPKGSLVNEIKLDAESDTYPSGFDEVARVLHNEWAEVSSRADPG